MSLRFEQGSMAGRGGRRIGKVVVFLVAVSLLLLPGVVGARQRTSDALVWMGHTWKMTNGGMAGVAAGNPANISIDTNGYLHLQIVDRGGTYTASEMFSRDNMGYGTYQWWLQGPVDDMDKSTVLGLFPYGPAHRIGAMARTNSISSSPNGTTPCVGAPAMRTSRSIHPRGTVDWVPRRTTSISTW